MADSVADDDEPCYVISVASRMVGVHAQTLRYYERIGLLYPARSRGNIRMFSAYDVRRARWIKSLMDDLGINLAGVAVMLQMRAAHGGTGPAGARASTAPAGVERLAFNPLPGPPPCLGEGEDTQPSPSLLRVSRSPPSFDARLGI